ncbi:tetratricopeptide repeat protein [Candidatus Peregrinibacteria bacterium]|nr:tetratricopeptide repeat protein [Candidatus Peregrinibacteria bacterium]MBI3816865.1 tetratricopeptide repeat protein [Candidatus Peregrinibacteria bacterium]
MPPPDRDFSLRAWFLLAIALTGIALLVYGVSLRNSFVDFDDGVLIFKNPIVQGPTPTNVAKAFTSYDPELYIPLTFVSYQFDYLIAGLHPFLYHAHNLALHIANALLVFWLALLLVRRKDLAILCALLFLVHPLNTEAVAWAAARKDLQSAFFFLFALATYIVFLRSEKRLWHWLSIATFLLALLSKVTVILLPFLLLALDEFEGRPWRWKLVWEKALYFLLSLLFGIIAYGGKTAAIGNATILDYILLGGKSVLFTLEKFLLPMHLSVLYPYTAPITLASPHLLFSLFVMIALLVIVIVSRRWTRAMFLCACIFFLTIAPTFGNVNRGDGFLDFYFAFDRYAYLPMIGLLLLIAFAAKFLLEQRNEWRMFPLSLTIPTMIITTIFGVLAFRQSLVWAKTETLFRNALALYPNSHLAHNNVGNYLRDEGNADGALAEYKASIAIRPTARAWYNVGLIDLDKNLLPAAKKAFAQALALDPHHARAHLNLGTLLSAENNIDEATTHFEAAATSDPTLEAAFFNLGILYAKKGDPQSAITAFQQALILDPHDAEAWGRLAQIQNQIGEKSDAQESARRALAINPKEEHALNVATGEERR